MAGMCDLLVHVGLVVRLRGIDGVQLVVELFDMLLCLEPIRLDGLDDDLSIVLQSDDSGVFCAFTLETALVIYGNIRG